MSLALSRVGSIPKCIVALIFEHSTQTINSNYIRSNSGEPTRSLEPAVKVSSALRNRRFLHCSTLSRASTSVSR